MTSKKIFYVIFTLLCFQKQILSKNIPLTTRMLTSLEKKKAIIIISSKDEKPLLTFSQLFTTGIQTRYDKTESIYIFKNTKTNPLDLENLNIATTIAQNILLMKTKGIEEISIISIGSGIWTAALTSQLLTLYDTEFSFYQKNSLDETIYENAVKRMDSAFKEKKKYLWKTILNIFSPRDTEKSSLGNAPRNKKFIHSQKNVLAFIKTLYVINPNDPPIQFFFDLNTIEKMINVYTANKEISTFMGLSPFTKRKDSNKTYFSKIVIDGSSLCCNSCLPCKRTMNHKDKTRFMMLLGMRIKQINTLTSNKYTDILFSLNENDPLSLTQ